MDAPRTWLIYDLQKKVWWRDQQAGYTEAVDDAGRYNDGAALAIAERMNWSQRQVCLVPVNDGWLSTL